MTHFRRLIGVGTAVGVFLAAILTGSLASPAAAGCSGTGKASEYSLQISPGPILRERPYPYSGSTTTCDRDNQYRGQLQDVIDGDGFCAWSVWRDPSQSAVASQCTTGPWLTYNAWDQQGNSSASYALCGDWQCRSPVIFTQFRATHGF